MAQKKAEPMWLARDVDCTSADLGCRDYSVHAEEPALDERHEWGTDCGGGLYIAPAQSPVSLPPGGPVKVWLADEREHAMIEAARMLVRSTKDGLDIVASGHYDEIERLCEGEA